jgi:hypothetical protein
MLDFSLQDIGIGSGSTTNDMSAPNSTFNWDAALGGLAVGVAASAANVGLQTLAKNNGVTAGTVNPYLGNGYAVVPPRQSSTLFASSLGTTSGTALMVGALGFVGLGLLLWAALRKG